ncbi:MAG: helix-turn-helix domain-containing protein [Corallococcus sp.]|nr:helix-turn-helix domain-containing protein [Corallococcus sp.]MCM1359003.1 helix-turn-helix domain-containing protein [Corallococcus sp.]MCM1394992.1 helix-turn-helix domain-containing protein [Corallococcus sp.]
MLKLKEIRQDLGISQGDLAKKIGVQNYTIGNWERDRSEPSVELIVKLADALGVTADELLGRENYGTGIVEIKGETLDADERKLLAAFRKLDGENRRRAIAVVDALDR